MTTIPAAEIECGTCPGAFPGEPPSIFVSASIPTVIPHDWDWDDDGWTMYYICPRCQYEKGVVGTKGRSAKRASPGAD